MHKRVLFYILMYSMLAVLTIAFLATSFIIENLFLQQLSAILLVLWLPLIFATILTHLPQTIAGNLFMYMRIRDKKKREDKFLTYCSGAFVGSEMYNALLNEEQYVKIRNVKLSREKRDKSDKTQYFSVILKDNSTYRVSVVKRDRRRENRYTTTYVVSDIQLTDAPHIKEKRMLLKKSANRAEQSEKEEN